MQSPRKPISEASEYQVLRMVIADLRCAERTLADIERHDPDPERALHLAAIRGALAQLETFTIPRSD